MARLADAPEAVEMPLARYEVHLVKAKLINCQAPSGTAIYVSSGRVTLDEVSVERPVSASNAHAAHALYQPL